MKRRGEREKKTHIYPNWEIDRKLDDGLEESNALKFIMELMHTHIILFSIMYVFALVCCRNQYHK